MTDTMTDVLVCGYKDVETAETDFETLISQVQAKEVRIQAVILISHDADGNVAVQRTGDSLGRKGLKWGGAVGFLVGLAAPPLLAATAVGVAGGGIVGKFAARRRRLTRTTMRRRYRRARPASAGRALVVSYPVSALRGLDRAAVLGDRDTARGVTVQR